MKWRFLGSPHHQPDPEHERRIQQAREKADALRERAERVVRDLEERNRRNHWSETAARIARGER